MIRVTFLLLLVLTTSLHASERLGLKDISIVELNGKLILQVDHLFLGAGERQANVILHGCKEGMRNFEIKEKNYSEFLLDNCTLVSQKKAYVDLVFGNSASSEKYASYCFINEATAKASRVSQIENYFSARLRLQGDQRKGYLMIDVTNKKGVTSRKNAPFSLIFGSTLYYTEWLENGSLIERFAVNDKNLNIDYEQLE